MMDEGKETWNIFFFTTEQFDCIKSTNLLGRPWNQTYFYQLFEELHFCVTVSQSNHGSGKKECLFKP